MHIRRKSYGIVISILTDREVKKLKELRYARLVHTHDIAKSRTQLLSWSNTLVTLHLDLSTFIYTGDRKWIYDKDVKEVVLCYFSMIHYLLLFGFIN